MDQTIINWLFAGFGAAVGWVLKVVWDIEFVRPSGATTDPTITIA